MTRPDEALAIDDALASVRNAMQTVLEPRELAIIEARFGFDGDMRTVAWIGADQKVSVTRIRQIETKALRKLKGGHLRRTLYDALEVLGGRLQPSLRPGTEAYNGLWLKQQAHDLAQQAEGRRLRMLELDAERVQLGDNPAHDEFSSFLSAWRQVSWSAEIEYNAFVNASDWQIHRRRQGLIEEGETAAAAKLTPELRDAERARLGLKPYPNQHPVAEWLALYADSAEAQSA